MYQPLPWAAAGSAKAAAANPTAVTTEAILMLFPFPFYCWNVDRTLTKPPPAGTMQVAIRDPRGPVLLPKCNAKWGWRRESESNRRPRLCRPLHDHSAIPPAVVKKGRSGLRFDPAANRAFPSDLERETSLELATSTLARLRSTN